MNTFGKNPSVYQTLPYREHQHTFELLLKDLDISCCNFLAIYNFPCFWYLYLPSC